ncbi:GH92 family glycosyl hydrolase [Bacteroidales bacterium OttesenSCG-928-K03]|nr:GH92 family glycosyl hydrolase [Bacteroidales bacterium OttesenSCG-928-L14]MDL2240982.1 GH92 family glycosyl hydrolase [Bacteroidales bacterium OttesenSCG-928-K22]MDL2242191.1 GH92 family glycosyl hydrolase [Bacteroidales bacterium OttesenSCG-928-K03]
MLKQSITICFLCLTITQSSAQKDYTKYVNPMIGTKSMGHTFPGACVPFGHVQLSPDTDNIPHNIDGKYQKDVYNYCAGYQYDDNTIIGFSHTHFNGTGHSDLGDILIMPYTGETKLIPGTKENPELGYRSTFNHNTEKSEPGYYEVKLESYDILAQLTATQRAGVHKYTFPENERAKIILDLKHGIYNYDGKVLWANVRVENDTLITGYRITNGWSRENYTYFAISFSKKIENYGYKDFAPSKYQGFWRKFNMNENFPEIGGKQVVCWFEFCDDDTDNLEIKVALSAVSTEGALKNLQAEASPFVFDEIKEKAHNTWNKALSVIDAKGTDDQLSMLYTSLYHTMINPSIYMDVDGNYRGIDHNIHKAEGFTNYTIFSVWDTFRALHPLLNIIDTDRSKDILNSMLAHYSQSVHKALPVWSHMGNENWCMIGYHSVSVMADAIAKNIPIDNNLAFEAMINSSNLLYYDNIADYKQLGYVPIEKNGSAVSITLEYAYDDWTIYNTALKLGKTDVAEEYKKRALNYKNLFDSEIKFFRPKYSDGRWKKDFDVLETHGQGFIEGNSWNYSFFVPHDVEGLIELMGGDKAFINRLDSLFTMFLPDEFFENTEDVTREGIMGNYVHGNEPSHHIPYLYAWTSEPWKAQFRIREIMNEMYKNKIDGLCGNDDCGQMSAWYIFSAMGFYPVCPGSDQYVFGAPYLPYMEINLPNSKKLVIKADRVSDRNRYIKSIKLNGKLIDRKYITHAEIMNGGILEFEMVGKK